MADLNITTLPAKTVPISTDVLVLIDSAASNALKNSTVAQVVQSVAPAAHNQSADTITDGTTNKAFLATERTKLTGIATGATLNSADATLLARANHTGTQLSTTVSDFSEAVRDTMGVALVAGSNVTITPNDAGDTITISSTASSGSAVNLVAEYTTTGIQVYSDNGGTIATLNQATGTTAGVLTAANFTKLSGIATGATANSNDSTLLNRGNHTGTQLASTVSDFSEAVDDRVAVLIVAGTNMVSTYNDGANTLTLSTVQQPLAQTVAYTASLTVNAALGSTVKVGTLTGDITINAPTNPVEGYTLVYYLQQDATGGRTVTFNSIFKNAPTIDSSAPASAHDLAAFVYVNSVWVRSRV